LIESQSILLDPLSMLQLAQCLAMIFIHKSWKIILYFSIAWIIVNFSFEKKKKNCEQIKCCYGIHFMMHLHFTGINLNVNFWQFNFFQNATSCNHALAIKSLKKFSGLEKSKCMSWKLLVFTIFNDSPVEANETRTNFWLNKFCSSHSEEKFDCQHIWGRQKKNLC
jgi:hypothetical protein